MSGHILDRAREEAEDEKIEALLSESILADTDYIGTYTEISSEEIARREIALRSFLMRFIRQFDDYVRMSRVELNKLSNRFFRELMQIMHSMNWQSDKYRPWLIDYILHFKIEQHIKIVWVYNLRNESRLIFQRKLAEQYEPSEGKIYVTKDLSTGIDLIVKWVPDWYMNREKSTYEGVREKYALAKRLGMPTVEIYDDYFFFGVPVLVMEKLVTLPWDDENWHPLETEVVDMGVQLIRSLQMLHVAALHLDIKPDNIAYRELAEPGKRTYMFIDLDDISVTRSYYGFERNTHTPLYTSQVRDSELVATWKNDMLELLYTLNSLAKHREFFRNGMKVPNAEILRQVKIFNFSDDGVWLQTKLFWMRNFLNEVSDWTDAPRSVYDGLVDILRKTNPNK